MTEYIPWIKLIRQTLRFWIVIEITKLKPKLNLLLKLWKGLVSPVIDVTVMKDSLLVYVLNFFQYFWSSNAELNKNIDTRLSSWLSDAARLTEVGGLNFLGRIFFRLLLVPDMCTTLKKHNLSFPSLYLKVRGLFILWWWRMEGRRRGGGWGEILFRFVCVPGHTCTTTETLFFFLFL